MVQEKGLEKVYKGGLATYAMAQLIMAYLQSRNFVPHDLDQLPSIGYPANLPDVPASECRTPTTLTHGPGAGSSGIVSTVPCQGKGAAEKSPPKGLGMLLFGFLRVYGKFDWQESAVSVRRGGIVPRSTISWTDQEKAKSGAVLMVEDPMIAGRNLCASSFKAKQVSQPLSYVLPLIFRHGKVLLASPDLTNAITRIRHFLDQVFF